MKIKVREILNTIIPKYVYTGRKNILNLNVTDTFKYLILDSNTFPMPVSISPITFRIRYSPTIQLIVLGNNPYSPDFLFGQGQAYFLWVDITDPNIPAYTGLNENYKFYTEQNEIYQPIQRNIKNTKQLDTVSNQSFSVMPLDPNYWFQYNGPLSIVAINDTTQPYLPIYENGFTVTDLDLYGINDLSGSGNPNTNCLIQFRDQFYTELVGVRGAVDNEWDGSYGGAYFKNDNVTPCYITAPTHRPYMECNVSVVGSDNNYIEFLFDATGCYDPHQADYPVIERGGFPIYDINQLYFDWAIFGVNETGQYPALDILGYIRNDEPNNWNLLQLFYRNISKSVLQPYKKIKILLKATTYRYSTYISGSDPDQFEYDQDGCLITGVNQQFITKQAAWAWTEVKLP